MTATIKNLINIYALFDNKTPEEVVALHAGQGYGAFKNNLTEVLVRELGEFQKRMNEWTDERVLEVLEDGRRRATEQAEKKLQEVYQKVGLLQV